MSFQRLDKEEAHRALATLVAAYRKQAPSIEAPGSPYVEAQVRKDFIDRFLTFLGWDLDNQNGLPQSQREAVVELSGSDEGVTGRPDYRLRLSGKDRLPVEAKKPSLRLGQSSQSAQQARSYGWSLSLPAAVLTNFSALIIYDTTITPEDGDGPDVAVIPGCRYTYEEYLDRFDELWDRLSHESVASDRFYEIYQYTEPPRGTSPFDQTFLIDFRRWRLLLARDIAINDPALGTAEVGRRTQLVLNALLFLRVCEDRHIGRYRDLVGSAEAETLVAAFRQADKVFNAGLFTVLEATAVTAKALAAVIRQLYWPQSKFAFGVLRPDILASLYEQYLAERVELDTAGRVTLATKPELTHAGGVVPTPGYVVDALVDAALSSYLTKDQPPPQTLTLLDPACGSGAFLVAALTKLTTAAEIAGDVPDLGLRARLAKLHLFGVDIDGEAVEVTKLSLLLAVLGDELVDIQTARELLPDLAENIQVGNSLIDGKFDSLFPTIAANPQRRAKVAPFKWETAFPKILEEGGFQVIVGNPPYIRIQVLSEVLPDQLAYFQDARSGYASPQAYNFDEYMLFVERALTLLQKEGRLAFIIPNRFTNGLAGAPIRTAIGPRLVRLVHFGQEQVFVNRTTYTALIVVGPKTDDPALFELVDDLHAWRRGQPGSFNLVDRAVLTGDPWPIASADRAAIFSKMDEAAIARLGDKGWVNIFVGVQTSADEIYFIKPLEEESTARLVAFRDQKGAVWRIEPEILRPAIKDVTLSPYDYRPEPDCFGIFPYVIHPPSGGRKRGRAETISPKDMRRLYPRTLEYFEAHKHQLVTQRNVTPDPGESFYAYGRSQSLTKLVDPKIIVRVLSLTPQYVYDPDGLVAPGGGDGGPYYFMRPEPDCPLTIQSVIALCSHPAVDAYVASRGKAYRGSYVVHRKRFLETVPVPFLDATAQEDIANKVNELHTLVLQTRTETDTSLRASHKGRMEVLRREIERAITDAFGISDEDVTKLVD